MANQLKTREASYQIAGVKNKKGRLVTSQREINLTFKNFYKELYSSDGELDMDKTKAFFEHLNLPKIAEEDMQWLDRPITIKELQDTIKTLPNSKSPGIDGIPCKFYKVFAEQPAPELLKTFTAAIEGNELPPSMTEVVISVILKKGKDPQECGSYRPFSLLCCNGKLLTKLLAIRVNHIIKSIIQVGFVKGCKSSDNLRRLLHVMWNAKDLPLSAAALSLDAEKAFDRVGWDYLNYTLKTFGFGNWFRDIIKLLNKHPKSMLTTNSLFKSVGGRGRAAPSPRYYSS